MTQDERRFHPQPTTPPITAVCRTCWAHVELLPERIETIEGRVYYRCQACERTFLIRWADSRALQHEPAHPANP